MAAEEVIYFPRRAQPFRHLNPPALSPPEPVAEPPAYLKTGQIFVRCCGTLGCCATRVPNQHSERSSGRHWAKRSEGQRLELHPILSRRELRTYAIRLEEIRAGLNADFSEVMAAHERADEFRFWSWRPVLERQKERAN